MRLWMPKLGQQPTNWVSESQFATIHTVLQCSEQLDDEIQACVASSPFRLFGLPHLVCPSVCPSVRVLSSNALFIE